MTYLTFFKQAYCIIQNNGCDIYSEPLVRIPVSGFGQEGLNKADAVGQKVQVV